MSASKQALLDQLAPVLEHVASLPLDDCRDADGAATLADRLQQVFPADGEAAQQLGRTLRTGVAEGWLCDRGDPDARFSRVAKASEQTRDLSIDIVSLQGPALRHRHPRGEVTLGFPADPEHADGRFEDQPAGWVVMPAGSVHTPTVTGSRMLLLYFLPAGAVEWNPAD